MDGALFDDRTLRRTMALLVALAALCERVAHRSFPARLLVLFLLHRAEALAREVVAAAAMTDGLWFDDGLEGGSNPQDAILLGLRFSTLAAVLDGLLRPAEPRTRRVDVTRWVPRRRPRGGAGLPARPRAAARVPSGAAPDRLNDTS
jgi:hypothetical protein